MTLRMLVVPPYGQRALIACAAVGAGAFVHALVRWPERAFAAFLVACFYWLALSVGALAFVALGQVGAAGWSSVLRRVGEGLASWLPAGALLGLGVIAGAPHLFHWAHADAVAADGLLQAKAPYLNLPFFAGRTVAILGLWALFSWLLRRESRRSETHVARISREKALAAGFLVLCAVSLSVLSVDWLMSLEPHWQSTMFGLYNISGALVAGVAGITVLAILLHRAGLLPAVTADHLHDLGKYLFGLSTFWAYLWFSQYMLIWYANIPEEATYYVARTGKGWGFLFGLNLIAGWAVPFLALLPRGAKRSEAHLFRIAVWVLIARWLDIYLMATPPVMPVHTGIGLTDVAVFLGMGAVFALVVARSLGAAPLLARGDPYLIEGLHHRT